MSSRTNSNIDICARSLVLIGAEPITSFSDGNTESLVASNLYEDIAQTSLTNTRWRFATNQAVLNRETEEPTGRWDASYEMPNDLIMLHAVTVNDYPINYDTYGSKVFCDAASADSVVADYTFRADEVNWPPYFVVAVEFTMASVFAAAIARDASMSNMYEQKALLAMAKARGLDSQQQTSRRLPTSRFITNRRS